MKLEKGMFEVTVPSPEHPDTPSLNRIRETREDGKKRRPKRHFRKWNFFEVRIYESKNRV